MSESTLKPTFSSQDLHEIIPCFDRKISSGVCSDFERTRPEDGDADILALIGHEGTAVFTVVRLLDGYAAYDAEGRGLGESQNVTDLLNLEELSGLEPD